MKKEIYIRFKDGEKESELRIDNLDAEHQLALVDGVFKFFDIDVDFKEMAYISLNSRNAYKEFFDNQEPEVDYKEDILAENPNPLRKMDTEQYAEAVKETVNILSVEDKPTATIKPDKKDESYIPGFHHSYDPMNTDYFTTGLKYDSLGRPQYKCRYKCPNCNDESNHYIKTDTKHVRCWKCQRMLKVKPATVHGIPEKDKDPELYRDSNGNFFMGGAFEMDVRTLSNAENETEEFVMK